MLRFDFLLYEIILNQSNLDTAKQIHLELPMAQNYLFYSTYLTHIK